MYFSYQKSMYSNFIGIPPLKAMTVIINTQANVYFSKVPSKGASR